MEIVTIFISSEIYDVQYFQQFRNLQLGPTMSYTYYQLILITFILYW